MRNESIMNSREQTPEQINSTDRKACVIGIIGLGLIGGSLAKACAMRRNYTMIGLDRDAEVIRQALSDKVLSAGGVLKQKPAELAADPQAEQDVWQILAPCQYVFVCTPVETAALYADQAALFCTGLMTDVASVKKPVLNRIKTERFVGGHPMAGSERHGYQHASDSLFENAIYVICLQPGSQLPVSQLLGLEQIIRDIGATPLHMAADVHDHAVAAVSHLPHVVASALSLLAAAEDGGELTRLAAGGFRDITRIASANPALWADICQYSAAELVPLLDHMLRLLREFRDSLQSENYAAVERFFYQAAQYRNALPTDGRGALAAHSTLTVYINDKPGELGRVTTLLGEQGINISNVRIREFRAYEGGCLQLLISSSAQAMEAAWILKEAGYVCD